MIFWSCLVVIRFSPPDRVLDSSIYLTFSSRIMNLFRCLTTMSWFRFSFLAFKSPITPSSVAVSILTLFVKVSLSSFKSVSGSSRARLTHLQMNSRYLLFSFSLEGATSACFASFALATGAATPIIALSYATGLLVLMLSQNSTSPCSWSLLWSRSSIFVTCF